MWFRISQASPVEGNLPSERFPQCVSHVLGEGTEGTDSPGMSPVFIFVLCSLQSPLFQALKQREAILKLILKNENVSSPQCSPGPAEVWVCNCLPCTEAGMICQGTSAENLGIFVGLGVA